MTDDPMLTAIENLTKAKSPKVIQSKNGISCVSQPRQDSLLEQLRDAVAGGIMGHANSSDSSGKWPINAGALTLYTELEETAGQWHYELTGTPSHLYPETNLSEWYLALTKARAADNVTDEHEARALRSLRGWAARITAMFDPPARLELTYRVQVPVVDRRTGLPASWADGTPRLRWETRPAPCPACHESFAFDPSTGDQIAALIVEYRRSEGESALSSATASCRFCERSWSGEFEMRVLRSELDEMDGALDPGMAPA